jgi:hypothetical protein
MSCHGTHVVVIEIPQGTPQPAAGDSLNLQTANRSTTRYQQLAFLATSVRFVRLVWLYRLWTYPRRVGATDLRLTNRLPTGVGES